MTDAPKVAPQPWLAVRFEIELKGLPPGYVGLTRSAYSIGHTEPVSLADVLTGMVKTVAEAWLEYLESNPEEALAALGLTAEEFERLGEVFSDARVVLQSPPEADSHAP